MAYTKPAPGYGIDWSHPLASGLAMCYAMQEGGGLFRDLVTPSRTLSLTSVAWGYAGQGGAGMVGSTSSSIATPSATQATGTVYTLEALLTPTAIQSYTQRVISAGGATGNGLLINTTDGLIQYAASGVGISSATAAAAGKLIHAAAVVNGSASVLYVNGKQENTGTNGSSLTIDALLNRTTGARGTVATVHLLRVWTRALSGAEVRALAIAPYGMFQKPYQRRRFAAAAAVTFVPPNTLSNMNPNTLGGF